MTFPDAWAAHEHDEEQDRLAADQTPATEPSAHYCGVHGDLLAAPRSARCAEAPAGHEYTRQTPATDYRATTATLRNAAASDGTNDDLADLLYAAADIIDRLTALLAERAATIEQVAATLPWWESRGRPHADGSILAKSIRTALGSQRTEGQG